MALAHMLFYRQDGSVLSAAQCHTIPNGHDAEGDACILHKARIEVPQRLGVLRCVLHLATISASQNTSRTAQEEYQSIGNT